MKITVNGMERQVAQGQTVLSLLAEAKLTPERVAVEVNKRLIRTERYGEQLRDGDQIEIVTFVGGG
jgi:sulfur carrier protein